MLTAAAVEEGPRTAAPPTPVVGDCYIVGASPTGEWAGKSGCLAGYSSGGWRFIVPTEGLSVYVKSAGTCANFRSAAWELGIVRGDSLAIGGEQVVGGRLAAITGPSGGTNVDAEARATINQMLAALRQHGLIES